ncbi:hypothetical protein ABGT15_04270 [Flavobacterium enshiense]|uniref:hypothetical protein n=1 Tax=Flavobacterium enshiense TaxID=1341165 RepID=UPI00345C90E9
MQNYNDFILTRSPYYITYSATASLFDYATLDLWVWSGDKTTPPSTKNFSLTSYKARTSDNSLYFQVNDYINGFLDPQISDNTYFTGNTASFVSTEAVWVKWVLKSYKLSAGVGTLYQTSTQSGKPATLGYGYVTDGYNPTLATSSIINQSDRFGVDTYYHYNVSLNTTTNQSSQLFTRVNSTPANNLCLGDLNFYQIIFLNKWGVFDTMDFSRKSTRSISINSEKYDAYRTRPDIFSQYRGTSRIYNINANEEWILNTDLLDDYNNEVMEQLFLSDRWWLYDAEKQLAYPVILTDKKFDEKLGVYEGAMIQWTLKFESANNKINDIR